MSEFEDVTRRLGALGHQPVDEEVAARHAAMLASLDPLDVPRRRTRQVVAGAVVAGALFGGGGLAGALTGNLPDPLQDTAHTALAKVGVDVPKGDEDLAEDAASDAHTARAGGGPAAGQEAAAGNAGRATGTDGTERVSCGEFNGNHGQYVAATPDDPATPQNERQMAAQAECGKPVVGAQGKPQDTGRPADAGRPDHAGRPDGAGRPADAGPPEGTGRPDDGARPAGIGRGRTAG